MLPHVFRCVQFCSLPNVFLTEASTSLYVVQVTSGVEEVKENYQKNGTIFVDVAVCFLYNKECLEHFL